MWRFRWTVPIAFGVAFVTALMACRDPRHADYEIPVRLAHIQGDPRIEADVLWVRKLAEEAIDDTRFLGLARDPGSEAAEATLTWMDVSSGLDGVLRLDIELAQRVAQAPGLGIVDAHVELARSDGSLELTRDLPIAIERAAGVLDAKVGLGLGDLAVARQLLAGEDPELRLMAVDWVAERGRADLLEAVVPRLLDPDGRVAGAALECVGALGDSRYAEALIAAARLSDRDHTTRLYTTLGALGGPAAEGFLEFAARNEDDPVMANVARQAWSRARTGSKSPTERVATQFLRGHRQVSGYDSKNGSGELVQPR